MKLDLKHLKHYLDTDLKFGKDNQTYHEFIMFGLVNKDVIAKNSMRIYEIKDYKPILRPLSDLSNKDLDWWIDLAEYVDGLGMNNEHLINALINKTKYVLDVRTYDKVKEFLYKNNFDVFGLIEKHLAIDINTIN